MRLRTSANRALAATLAAGLCAAAASAEISIAGPGVDPDDFRISVVATGLAYPTSLQQLEDGSLLVLTNDPNAGLFDSVGELVRLVDADDDGVADGPPQLLYSGLPGIATSVRKAGSLVFVSSQELDGEAISVLRTGASVGDPYTLIGSLDFGFAAPSELQNHRNVALGLRVISPTEVDLLFNMGSDENAVATPTTFSGSGLLTGVPGAGSMNLDSIYGVRVTDTGGGVALSNLQQIAAGLRNAAGIAFQPSTGDLYFSENGIDPIDPAVQSADELDLIAAADVGGAVEDFGFPSDYVEYRTGTVTTGLSVQPLQFFQPIPDPFTGAESEGPVEIAFAPPFFPAPLAGGLFIGFHGIFSYAGVANDENPVVFIDLDTLDYFHFVENSEPTLGHPNGLLATADSLYIADLTSSGNVFSNATDGAIHQIRANTAVPALAPLAGAAATALLSLTGWLALRRHGLARR